MFRITNSYPRYLNVSSMLAWIMDLAIHDKKLKNINKPFIKS